MIYLICSGVAFVLLFLYDINSVKWDLRAFKPFFLVANAMVVMITFELLRSEVIARVVEINFNVLLLAMAAAFLGLLIYTLFFALPFSNTYLVQTERRKAYCGGVYALCRHPGVLWFTGFFYTLALIVPSPTVMALANTLVGLNIAYVIFQDLWTFPNLFYDYNTYKKTTPFLIPNFKSAARCFGVKGSEVKA